MKKIIFMFILMGTTFFIFGLDYNTYSMELIQTKENGRNSGQIAGDDNVHVLSPSGIGMIDDQILILSDTVSDKIIHLNLDSGEMQEFYYTGSTFQGDKDIHYMGDMLVGHIHSVIDFYKEGNVLYLQLNKINPYVDSDNILFFNDIFFFYTEDGKILSIINPSIDQMQNRANYLNNVKTRELFELQDPIIPEGLTLDQEDRLFLNGKLVTRDFHILADYIVENHRGMTNRHVNGFEDQIFSRMTNIKYLGIDNDGNIYWLIGTYRVLVLDPDYWLIDSFNMDYEKAIVRPVVSSSGDIYTISYDDSQVYIWKTSRQWGFPEQAQTLGE